MEWGAFEILIDHLAVYLVGSYPALGLIATVLFLMGFLAVGLELKYAFPASLPILAGFVAAGWFGQFSFIWEVGLIIVAIIYGVGIMTLMRR